MFFIFQFFDEKQAEEKCVTAKKPEKLMDRLDEVGLDCSHPNNLQHNNIIKFDSERLSPLPPPIKWVQG